MLPIGDDKYQGGPPALAVPLLAVLKIACDHTEGLAPLAEFLAD